MKITGINIGEYRQFKNINFDFTYPADHAKAGQPLDKVCFIGQSGTGKTTLLNLIWGFFRVIEDSYLAANNREVIHNNWADFDFLYHLISIKIQGKGSPVSYEPKDLSKYDNHRQVRIGLMMEWLKENNLVKAIHTTKKNCLFIKDSISREADAFLLEQKESRKSFSDFIKSTTEVEKDKVAYKEWINEAGSRKTVLLGDMDSLSTWKYLLKDIDNYDEETLQQLTKIIQDASTNKLAEEIQKWVVNNPRFDLAEKCLNPILGKFFLEVDTEGKTAPVALRTKQGVKIDSSYLSTGTRQILATAIPIYVFDTTDTVILFDEPERSLFPDIQRDLVQYYTGLAPTAQFFFATHSPIIAAAFEPCERFILDFNEDGEVICRKGVAPIGDDPNDILSADFGMDELMNDDGLAAYERYRNLGVAIRNEQDPDRKQELIVERAKLGDDYRF